MLVDPHRLAEARSLAFHRVVADRMASNPAILERARDRVQAWLAQGIAPSYARAWERILRGNVDQLHGILIADTEEARALRQSTPFAGAVEPRERWRIWKETRERLAG